MTKEMIGEDGSNRNNLGASGESRYSKNLGSEVNKTTKQYQKEIEELDKECKVEWVERGHFRVMCGAPFPCPRHTKKDALKEHIKQHTLSILQSEYDRLEGEFKMIDILKMGGGGSEAREEIRSQGYNKAIQSQQYHFLDIIKEIKSL